MKLRELVTTFGGKLKSAGAGLGKKIVGSKLVIAVGAHKAIAAAVCAAVVVAGAGTAVGVHAYLSDDEQQVEVAKDKKADTKNDKKEDASEKTEETTEVAEEAPEEVAAADTVDEGTTDGTEANSKKSEKANSKEASGESSGAGSAAASTDSGNAKSTSSSKASTTCNHEWEPIQGTKYVPQVDREEVVLQDVRQYRCDYCGAVFLEGENHVCRYDEETGLPLGSAACIGTVQVDTGARRKVVVTPMHTEVIEVGRYCTKCGVEERY